MWPLRVFANVNRLPLSGEDRVFILLGGSYIAFFREFMKRSPKHTIADPRECPD